MTALPVNPEELKKYLAEHDRQRELSQEVQHRLNTFAFHISTLARAKPGDKFGLSFWGNVYVDVEVGTAHDGVDDPNWNTFYFRQANGLMSPVGNYAGAMGEYAKLCAPSFIELLSPNVDSEKGKK